MQVDDNLRHQQLWKNVQAVKYGEFEFCRGIPAKKLHPDDPSPLEEEYVLCSYTANKWSVEQWAKAFAALKEGAGLGTEPKRLVMAMVTNDSTVVYYIVNNGLVAPRK